MIAIRCHPVKGRGGRFLPGAPSAPHVALTGPSDRGLADDNASFCLRQGLPEGQRSREDEKSEVRRGGRTSRLQISVVSLDGWTALPVRPPAQLRRSHGARTTVPDGPHPHGTRGERGRGKDGRRTMSESESTMRSRPRDGAGRRRRGGARSNPGELWSRG